VRVEKLMRPAVRDVIDIPAHPFTCIPEVDAIGPDHQPAESALPSNRWAFWLTWDQ
jgi:hypothetical protein